MRLKTCDCREMCVVVFRYIKAWEDRDVATSPVIRFYATFHTSVT